MKRVITTVATMLLVLAAFAQQAQPLPVDPAVRTGKLENGLTYYVRHNAEPKGQANFYIAQNVGSILEEENQRGLAHFLEHMCFNGTQKFPGNGVIKYCESIGVKFGANLNAYTSMDETVYNIDNVPVEAVPSSVDSCLWILHDWADGLLLTDEDIDHERGVIHEEWRMRSTARLRMLEQVLPEIYPSGNRYGCRLPIGTMEVVDNFPYKALRDYYEKWYRPDQQAIIVVGDIDVDAVEGKVKEIFSTIKMPENPAPRTEVEVPDNDAPIVCIAKDKEQTKAETTLFLKHDIYPKTMRNDVNFYVYNYVLDVASRMLNARLGEMRQRPNAPFISASVGDDDFFIARSKSSFTASVTTSETGVQTGVTAVYRETLRALRNGFTATEYDRAKAQVLADVEAQYNGRSKKSSQSYCKELVQHYIANEPVPGIEIEWPLYQQIANGVTVDMVNAMFKEIVPEKKNLVIAAMLPDKDGVTYPTKEQLTAALQAVENEDIKPYKDEVSNKPLLSKEPKAGRVTNILDDVFGFKKMTLSNGAVVYFRQTDFNPNEIMMMGVSPGGKSICDKSSPADLKAINEVMNLGGVGHFNATELKKALAGRKVTIHAAVGTYDEFMNGFTTPKDFETMLQLSYLYFTSMRSDNDAFTAWKERSRDLVANQEKDPQNALMDTLFNVIYDNGDAMKSLRSEDFDKLNYKHIMKMAKERFSNAGDFTFIIIGAVDEHTLIPLLEKYVASLPAKKTRERRNLDYVDFAKKPLTKVFEREMEIPMTTNVFFECSDMPYTLKNNLAVQLGLNALSVELMEDIREKEGGTYSIGAYGGLQLNPAPRCHAFLQIPYQCDPDKYERLNQRVRDIVAKFVKEGPSAENLAKGKEYYLKNYKDNLRKNAYWTQVLSNYLDTNVDELTDFETVLQSITAEDVRMAVKTIVDAQNHTEVIMVGKKK